MIKKRTATPSTFSPLVGSQLTLMMLEAVVVNVTLLAVPVRL